MTIATRPSILRLERQRTVEHQEALTATRGAYADLAEAVLQAASEVGYLGQDPAAALMQLRAPSPAIRQLSDLTIQLWQGFFAGFRQDEQAFEARAFAERARDLDQHLAAVPAGADPDPALVQALLETLIAFWQDRQQALSQRLDELITDLGQTKGRAESADLQVAYQQDELSGIEQVVAAALAELGRSVPADASFARQVELLVAAYRRALVQAREQGQQAEALHAAHLVWLRRVLGDTEAAEPVVKPTGEARRLLKTTLDAVQERGQLEQAYRQLHEELAQIRTELAYLQEEVQARDRLIARYEFGERADENEDERLQAYRAVVTAFQRGEEPGELLVHLRKLEMVLALDGGGEQRARQHLDRQLHVLTQCLADLRRLLPLGEDPRRYRPRLLGAQVYRFKTLQGNIQALRDAARDVLAYLDRARWVAGLRQLEREFRRLRKVFKEMVQLTADMRAKVGDAPPVSLSISLESTAGCADLPAVLADDIDALARKRGVGPKALGELSSLLEDVLDLFQTGLSKAIGQEVTRAEPGRRESAKRALERQCRELRELAARMEAVFAEAAERGWRASPEEIALLEAESSLVLAIQQVDHACQDLALVPGAPTAEFSRVPAGSRLQLDALLVACKARVTWLEDLAQYRVRVS
jgi:hypothetical protein